MVPRPPPPQSAASQQSHTVQLCLLGDDGTSTTATLSSQPSAAPHCSPLHGALSSSPVVRAVGHRWLSPLVPHCAELLGALHSTSQTEIRRLGVKGANKHMLERLEPLRYTSSVCQLPAVPASQPALLPITACGCSTTRSHPCFCIAMAAFCCLLLMGDLKSLRGAVIKRTKRRKAV